MLKIHICWYSKRGFIRKEIRCNNNFLRFTSCKRFNALRFLPKISWNFRLIDRRSTSQISFDERSLWMEGNLKLSSRQNSFEDIQNIYFTLKKIRKLIRKSIMKSISFFILFLLLSAFILSLFLFKQCVLKEFLRSDQQFLSWTQIKIIGMQVTFLIHWPHVIIMNLLDHFMIGRLFNKVTLPVNILHSKIKVPIFP